MSLRLRRLAAYRVCLLLLVALFLGSGWIVRQRWVVVGQVLSAGQPVEGARVGLKGFAVRVTTDPEGRFRLPLPSPLDRRVVAWKPEHYIAGADLCLDRPVTIQLQRHPTEDSPSYRWVDPNPDPTSEHNCANCHVEIYRQWVTSSHASSAVNRHFLDMFAGTDWNGRPGAGWNFAEDHPEARAVCAACHLPTVPVTDLAAGDPRQAKGIVREGIHCDFCHKVAKVDLSKIGLEHGRYAMRLVRPSSGRQIFIGPLDDVDRGQDTYAPIYRSSGYCASCHEGTLFGIAAYTTYSEYSEWKSSSYATRGVECQHCHMKPDGVRRNIAPGHGGIDRDPQTLATHSFAVPSDESFLRSCVDLQVRGHVEGNLLHAEVSVRAVNVGHCLPTGTPERHLLLLVQALDRDGRPLRQRNGPVIPEAGGVGPAKEGNYAGTAGKLYGKLLEGPDGEVPAPFWQAVAVAADTRLKPDQEDRSEFAFEPNGASGPVRLEVQLIYRRFYKAIIDAKSWPDRDLLLVHRRLELEFAQ